ncbi:hypothetical protein C1H76_8050 [Elsinoe australis]|uniref:Uncharacterized protein n=1 Tax=Elsinoe australis TaxID=40998 RepID=A0A4V6DTA6_9PEZI|nr:hypothetical protein C1H76_8050 [Elsinoe australis]
MASSNPLTALPIELLHHILSHLVSSHGLNHRTILSWYRTPWDLVSSNDIQRFGPLAPGTPLLELRNVNKSTRRAVDAYSHRLLLTWSHMRPYKPLKTPKLEDKRNHTAELLKLIHTHCVFCGRKSTRRATLMNGLGCCQKCDKEQWPDKITKTEAKTRFLLDDEHLFLWGSARPDEWPACRFGVYTVNGGDCMLFLRKEVERLARAVYEVEETDVKIEDAVKPKKKAMRTGKTQTRKRKKEQDAYREKVKRQKKANVFDKEADDMR